MLNLPNLKKLKIALLLVAVAISIMAIFFIFPKNISRLWIFGLILLADVYLWNSFKKVFRRNSGSPFYFFRVFYWFPEIMMVALLAIALFFRNVDAQNTLSSFVIGIAMMVFGAKIMAFFIISFEFLTRIFSWISMSFVDGKILWKFPVPRKKRIIKASLYLFYFLFFLFICGIFNTHRFEVKKEIVQTENLPQAFDGLKVVQISDIHLVSWILPRKMEKVVEKINELNPDIVAFTGDMVSFKSVEMLPYIDILSKVKAKYGVFTILGNHDYGDYVNWKNDEEKVQNFEDIITYYKQTSWVLLRNENRRIYSSDSSSSIVVAGVENWSASKRFHGIGNADLALKNVSDDDFVIFLSHDPSHWEYLMKKIRPLISLFRDIRTQCSLALIVAESNGVQFHGFINIGQVYMLMNLLPENKNYM